MRTHVYLPQRFTVSELISSALLLQKNSGGGPDSEVKISVDHRDGVILLSCDGKKLKRGRRNEQ